MANRSWQSDQSVSKDEAPKTAIEVPDVINPSELAAKLGCSERTLREVARRHGCCRIIGKNLFFTQEDIEALLEAVKAKPREGYRPSPSGSPTKPWTEKDTDELVARIETKKRRGRPRREPVSALDEARAKLRTLKEQSKTKKAPH